MRKIINIFLPINLNVCFGCSKEPSHCDSSFEYPQHMFWLRNKKVKFSLRTLKTKVLIQLMIIPSKLTMDVLLSAEESILVINESFNVKSKQKVPDHTAPS